MLEIKRIREDKDTVISALSKRGVDYASTIDRALELDEKRRLKLSEVEDLKHSMNQSSKKIGELFKSGEREKAEEAKKEVAGLKDEIKSLDEQVAEIDANLKEVLYEIPNAPHDAVPAGQSESDNEVVYQSTQDLPRGDHLLPHWELTDKYNIIDFETGVKISGAGFPVYRKFGAKLQRALINFFLQEAEKAGFDEVQVPHLVNEASGLGTGQLPDKEGQMYHAKADDLYLIPTAEVPITNMYRDTILAEPDLPVKNCGYTPCFRREAGSYGKDVRGLNRLHQFDKVEIVQITKPEDSYQALEEMLGHSKKLLEQLGLPYRVLRLCGGDLGFTAALTCDLEVWSAGQERWLEVSSVSNFESFQSNRLKLRYKDAEKKTKLAHTLNGSALALPRILASILENYQTEDGINVPEVLQSFTGFKTIN